MQPYQQRVVDEKSELDSKILNLLKFIETNDNFKSLPADEKDRLQNQSVIMEKYSLILGQRITAFTQ